VKTSPLIALFLLTCIGMPALAAAADQYPRVRVLSKDDALFVQQQSALDDFRRITEARVPGTTILPPLEIYIYTRRSSEDLFSLNARLSLRYDTLATLNGAGSTAAFNGLGDILIPSQDGLFVSNPPRTDLDTIILSTRTADGKTPVKLTVTRAGKRESLFYFSADSFTSIERAYFLKILYRTPVDKGKITSLYGYRADPFTGTREFHGGLDIGAPDGTPVYAAREGTVEETGTSTELGKYIVLTHAGGYQTVYGHLSAISVTIKDKVSVGTIIGAVGHTGHATGPHLHFEVRTKSGTIDPLQLIRVK
jgi:murein DD-endopeptidase MepM/ murein hydrolase activator NlpD